MVEKLGFGGVWTCVSTVSVTVPGWLKHERPPYWLIGGQCLVTAVSVSPTAAWCKELHSLGFCAACWLMAYTQTWEKRHELSTRVCDSELWVDSPCFNMSCRRSSCPQLQAVNFMYEGFVLTKMPVWNSAVHCISACCQAALTSCPTGSNKACLWIQTRINKQVDRHWRTKAERSAALTLLDFITSWNHLDASCHWSHDGSYSLWGLDLCFLDRNILLKFCSRMSVATETLGSHMFWSTRIRSGTKRNLGRHFKIFSCSRMLFTWCWKHRTGKQQLVSLSCCWGYPPTIKDCSHRNWINWLGFTLRLSDWCNDAAFTGRISFWFIFLSAGSSCRGVWRQGVDICYWKCEYQTVLPAL